MKFSYIGTILVLMVFLPNLLYILYPPKGLPEDLDNSIKLMDIIENIGRIGVAISLVMSDITYSDLKINRCLIVALLFLAMYYTLWLRYFFAGQYFSLLFTPILSIPIPMAIFPICYLFFLSIWMKLLYLGSATLVFGISHIMISWNTYSAVKS